MRVGQLKSLLAVLRAAGVSEFSDAKSGISLRLGTHAPASAVAGKGKKATEETPESLHAELVAKMLASKETQKALQNLGVDAETAARELIDVA